MARYTPRISRGAGGGGPTPPSSGGVGYWFSFDPTLPDIPAINRYGVWANLIAAINLPNLPDRAPPTITFQQPFTVPAGVWNMNGANLRASIPATGGIVLSVPAGATLDNVAQISNGLVVSGAPTADGTTFTFSNALPTEPFVLAVGNGGAIQNLSPNGSTLILTPGGGRFVVLAFSWAQVGSIPASTAPYIRAVAGDFVIGHIDQNGLGGKMPDDWVVGPIGATLIYQFSVDAVAPQTPGWLGTILPLTFAQATLSPLSQKGAVRQLIFTDAAPNPDDTDTFNVWADLYAYKQLIDIPLRIVFQQSDPLTPLHIPAGTWIMGSGVTWGPATSQGTPCDVYLDDGCVIQDLLHIEGGLAVVGNSTAVCMTYSPPSIPGNAVVVVVEGFIANVGTMAPMIQQTTTDTLLFGLLDGGAIAYSGFPGAAAVVDVTPAGAFASLVVMFGLGGDIGPNTLSGANAGGTAIVLFQPQDDGSDFNLTQPGWAGQAFASFFTSQQHSRYAILTSPLASGAAYNVQDGSEFVRCAPTGGGDISVVLPAPSLWPDQTVLVKKTTNNIVDNINVTAADASTIDGVATYPLPLTPYSVLRFTSDGVNWWVT